MALTVTQDKPVHKPGETITLTITSDQRLTSSDVTVHAGNEEVKVTTTVQTGCTVDDPLARTWTTVSDDGHVAVVRTTA